MASMLTLEEVRGELSGDGWTRRRDIELLCGLSPDGVRSRMTQTEQDVFDVLGEVVVFEQRPLTPGFRRWALDILARAA